MLNIWLLILVITAQCVAIGAVIDYYWGKAEKKYKKKAKEMKDLLSKAAQELNGVDDELVNQIQTVIEKKEK